MGPRKIEALIWELEILSFFNLATSWYAASRLQATCPELMINPSISDRWFEDKWRAYISIHKRISCLSCLHVSRGRSTASSLSSQWVVSPNGESSAADPCVLYKIISQIVDQCVVKSTDSTNILLKLSVRTNNSPFVRSVPPYPLQ